MTTAHAASGEPAAKPRLLFFYSGRDGRARRVEGYLAQVLQRRQNHDTFVIHRVDVDARPDLAARFGVGKEPVLMVVSGKTIRGRTVAPKGCEPIKELLVDWLN